MSEASAAIVGQNEVVLVIHETLLLSDTSDRLLHVEQALAAGRVSEDEANELLVTIQALRPQGEDKFPQEEERSGQRLTASSVTALHRFVWEAPRTIIDDPSWPRIVEPD